MHRKFRATFLALACVSSQAFAAGDLKLFQEESKSYNFGAMQSAIGFNDVMRKWHDELGTRVLLEVCGEKGLAQRVVSNEEIAETIDGSVRAHLEDGLIPSKGMAATIAGSIEASIMSYRRGLESAYKSTVSEEQLAKNCKAFSEDIQKSLEAGTEEQPSDSDDDE